MNSIFKWALIVWVILVLPNSVDAQNYLNETAKWVQSFSYQNFGNSTYCIYTKHFNGDSTYNNKIYYKLYSQNYCILTRTLYDSLGNPYQQKDTSDVLLFENLVREEDKKIYLMYSDSIERVYYNYNFGDTTAIDSVVGLNACGFKNSVSILNHDTVCVGNVARKRWKISYSQYPLAFYLIEGIGPSSGFLSPVCRNGCPECGYYLMSFTMNGDTLYKGNCAQSTGVVNKSEVFLKVYPIPTDDKLTIESSALIKSISVYDYMGRLIVRKNIQEYNYELSMLDYAKGNYVLEIITDGTIFKRKIVKE